jgi:hypothetical protein
LAATGTDKTSLHRRCRAETIFPRRLNPKREASISARPARASGDWHYERPSGPSKKVRKAVARQCTAVGVVQSDGVGKAESQLAAPANAKKKTGRVEAAGLRSAPVAWAQDCAAIREAWEREAKQRWDSRTHGRGLALLIVNMLALPGSLMSSRSRSPMFEFWRDQNKIRGRYIGVGNGVVVARLNVDGLPE